MEGSLDFNNILGEQDIETLFTEPEDDVVETPDDNEGEVTPEDNSTKEKENNITEVVNPETLFEEEPESVGSGKKENTKEKEGTIPEKDGDTSPNNFYSSIANALAVDGIFPNLDDETIGKANDAESFSNLIEAEVNARLDERQQRVAKALDNGVEPSDIKKYESTLDYISSITDASISEESENGERLRRNLIYQDFLNKGYSQEKAKKLTERSIDAGTDVEDAKEALQSNMEYFQGEYNKLLKEAQQKADEDRAFRQKQADKLKDSMLNDKQLLGDMEISKDLRKKAFESITKPVYKDTESGEYLTALQKYEMENRADFLKYVGLVFTLTNGFKDFDSFVKGKVKKEVRKGLQDLENSLINNSVRATDGSLRLVTNADKDPESVFGKGMKLDI